MNTKKKAFVIGDIHGMYQPFRHLLAHHQPDEQIIFLGDYIDRGPDSLSVLNAIWYFEQEYDAICLRGNHEQMLLNFLEDPGENMEHYIQNGGWGTIQQLLGVKLSSSDQPAMKCPVQIAETINDNHPQLMAWLDSLPYYYEFGNFVCVHAGVNLSLSDWRQSTKRDFIWIREPFFEGENQTGRQFIFGHTPIQYFPPSVIKRSLFYRQGMWGIDGGAVYQLPSSRLTGLKIDHDKILSCYQIKPSLTN